MVAMNLTTKTGREAGTQKMWECTQTTHYKGCEKYRPVDGVWSDGSNGPKSPTCDTRHKAACEARDTAPDGTMLVHISDYQAQIKMGTKHPDYPDLERGGTIIWKRAYEWLVATENIKPIRFAKGVSIRDKISDYLGIKTQSGAADAQPQPGAPSVSSIFDLRKAESTHFGTRAGVKKQTRLISENPKLSKDKTEAVVFKLTIKTYPKSLVFNFAETNEDARVGCDIPVININRHLNEPWVEAKVDAKPEKTCSAAQYDEAVDLHDYGIPYIITDGTSFYLPITPDLDKRATGWRF